MLVVGLPLGGGYCVNCPQCGLRGDRPRPQNLRTAPRGASRRGRDWYNERVRRSAPVMAALVEHLTADTSVAGYDMLMVDSTSVQCARSRETVKRPDLAGWAKDGYGASHARYFWGLRLHLMYTCTGCRSPTP